MYIFIVNPVAGNGRANKIYNKLKTSDVFQTIKSEVYFTEYHQHAKSIVENLPISNKMIKSIIVIGGDGTIHDVINGMKKINIPIAFIPGGSGNDFARGCLIKDKPIQLLEKIVEQAGKIDYWFGEYRVKEKKKRFANNIGFGFGFDAKVAERANNSWYKRMLSKVGLSNVSYLIALILVLFLFKPQNIQLTYNGKKRLIKDCWMITVSNHPYYGGGMKIIPTATIQPGIFPVLIVHSISKWKILALFMTVFTGMHLKFKGIELFETEKLEINSREKIDFHADGETSTCKQCLIQKERDTVHIIGTLYQSGN